MKTILVLSPHPNFALEVRKCLNAEEFRVIHRLSVEEGEPLLVHGLVAACILDADLLGVESIWIIERLRRRDAKTPIIAYTESVESDWEEEAFLRGVTHVLTKPLRHRLLNSILERLGQSPTPLRQTRPLSSMESALYRSNNATLQPANPSCRDRRWMFCGIFPQS
jgi:DNA-binding response OmpR family regulator